MGKVIKHAEWTKTGRKKKSPRKAKKHSRSGSSPTQAKSEASVDGIAPQGTVIRETAPNTIQKEITNNVTVTPVTRFYASNEPSSSLGEERNEQLPRIEFQAPVFNEFHVRDITGDADAMRTLVFSDDESDFDSLKKIHLIAEDQDRNSMSSASLEVNIRPPSVPFHAWREKLTSLGEEDYKHTLHKFGKETFGIQSTRNRKTLDLITNESDLDSQGEDDVKNLRRPESFYDIFLADSVKASKEYRNLIHEREISQRLDSNLEPRPINTAKISSASTSRNNLNNSVEKDQVSPSNNARLKATSSEKNAAVSGYRKRSSIGKVAENISKRTEPILNKLQTTKISLNANVSKKTEKILHKMEDAITAVDEKIVEGYEKEISRKLKKHAPRIEKNKREEKERLALWREPANKPYPSVNDGDKSLSLSQYDRLYLEDLKSASNPTTIPVSERESFQEYKQAINECKPSAVQVAIRAKMVKKNRKYNIYRRDIGYYDDGITLRVGSYPYETVDEKKMLKKNQNILRYAWKGKDDELYKELLWNFNDIDFQDKAGRTATHFAASHACVPCIEILCASLKLPNLNLQDDEGKTPLRKAVEVRGIIGLETIELLLEKGADPNIKAKDGRTPIEYAIMEKGDEALPIIKLLFIYGEQFKERREPGRLSYLHITSLANKNVSVLNTAIFLINHGVFINSTEGTGSLNVFTDLRHRTALIMAAMRDRVDLVKLLIQYGADTKHKDLDGRTALKYTVMRAKLGTQGAKRDTQGAKLDAQGDENCHKLIKDAIKAKETKHMKASYHRFTGKDVDDATVEHIRVQLGMMGKQN